MRHSAACHRRNRKGGDGDMAVSLKRWNNRVAEFSQIVKVRGSPKAGGLTELGACFRSADLRRRMLAHAQSLSKPILPIYARGERSTTTVR